MFLLDIEKTLEKFKKGVYVRLEWTTPKKVSKGSTDIVEKHCEGTFRLGITYSHTKYANGKTTGLKTGEFMEGFANLLISNGEKKKLRVYTTGCPNHKTKVQYTLNGEPTTPEYLIKNNICSPSSLGYKIDNGKIIKSSSNAIPCFEIPIENIIKIG